MQLTYGSYQFPASGVTIAISRQAKLTDAGVRYGYTETWRCRGLLEGSSQAALASAIAQLELATSVEFGDLLFFHNDGSLSAHGAISSGTFSGVRVVGPVSYPEGQGAEYATYRTFEVTFEFDVLYGAVGIISWVESVSFAGGGPRINFLETLNTLPVKQTLALAVPYMATQSGSAVGTLSYPRPPQPNWPGALKVAPKITEKAPKRRGNGFTEWQVDWAYEFESATPLSGFPNPQPNF